MNTITSTQTKAMASKRRQHIIETNIKIGIKIVIPCGRTSAVRRASIKTVERQRQNSSDKAIDKATTFATITTVPDQTQNGRAQQQQKQQQLQLQSE